MIAIVGGFGPEFVVVIMRGPVGATETRVVKKSSPAGEKKPLSDAKSKQWRASHDAPISLTSKPALDASTGQRTLVLAFAAVAVIGAGYFATVMISPEEDPTVITRANAQPQPPAASPAQPAADAVASAAPAAPKAAPSNYPTPAMVKTIAVSAATAKASEPTTQRVAAAQPAATPAPPINAYANDDAVVSEGVTAVMGLASTEKPAAAKTEPDVQVASAATETAANGAARRIRTAVTMRSGPRKGAGAIGTIPTNATVSVAPGCKSWCQVTWNGKTGYIYKGYLR